MNHIHLGLLKALTVFAEVIIIGFFWRIIASHNHSNGIGQAMSFVY